MAFLILGLLTIYLIIGAVQGLAIEKVEIVNLSWDKLNATDINADLPTLAEHLEEKIGNATIASEQTAQYSDPVKFQLPQRREEGSSSNLCPVPENIGYMTQTQLINALTDTCRYDRLEPPSAICKSNPNNASQCQVEVFARVYIYVLQNVDSSDLKFHMQGLLQVRFVDARLAFGAFAPDRQQPIMGETQLRELIWVPHIFLANEHDSSVLGTSEKDVLVSISPDGTVIISTRIQATLYCWMNLMKFPFDEQRCKTTFESWMYKDTDMMLHWESNRPVAFDPQMHLTEYKLQDNWANESVVIADLNDMRHGAFLGNYSALSFTVHLTRETGYYVMDYFLPSMMIVAISWVSFWLQADQTPARTTLGTSTLLSFITLASSQESNLPKVSYIKVSEIWFLGCTIFIFGSLIEFAFVNTIWRRRVALELKKVNSKYIFKSTLTPNMSRRKIETLQQQQQQRNNTNPNPNSQTRSASISSTSSSTLSSPMPTPRNNANNRFLGIPPIPPPIIITDAENSSCNTSNIITIDQSSNNELILQMDNLSTNTANALMDAENGNAHGGSNAGGNPDTDKNGKTKKKIDDPSTWFTMTPQEVAVWIDRKARFFFPFSFLIFNAIFWTFVYFL